MEKRAVRVVSRFGDDTIGDIPPKQLESDIRLVLVSDTHNVETDVCVFDALHGDLLIHGGDHSVSGTKEELERASIWLENVSRRFKLGAVCVGGNHDAPLDKETFLRWKQCANASKTHMGSSL